MLRHVRQWIRKADHDLRNAEHTLTLQEDCPFDTVCFHAQQCAEKYLKALLVWTSTDFPKTHDLVILTRLATEASRLVTTAWSCNLSTGTLSRRDTRVIGIRSRVPRQTRPWS